MKLTKTLLTVALLAGLAVVVALVLPDAVSRVAYAVESGQADAARQQLKQARDISLAFQHVATVMKPSVVSIRSVKRIAGTGRLQRVPTPFQDPFRGFFGDDLLERFFPHGAAPRGGLIQRGVGTGVIVSADGYILTNNHVVGGADKLTVTLSDERTFSAEVVGTDEKTDLAVVKIDARDLKPAQLGDSDQIKTGEWVLAIGNPFGLAQTVTAGIVSAQGRANVGIADYEDFIQTDAAINPGNSGGPLVNLSGQVIGISTAIATRSGGYQGIGFAIPSNMAKTIMDAIIKHGKVVRGWLGVVIQNLNEDLARSFGFDGTDGVLIGDVARGGPADEAGLKAGDIIVRFDGKPVKDMNQLRNTVATTKPGTKAEVEIVRQGRHKKIKVEIGELESQTVAVAGRESADELGFTVETLTPDVARRLGYPDDEQGVIVTAVEPGGLAERAGLQPKDVIVVVGDRRVKNVREFRAAMDKQDLSDGVRMQVKTEGVKRFIFLKR